MNRWIVLYMVQFMSARTMLADYASGNDFATDNLGAMDLNLAPVAFDNFNNTAFDIRGESRQPEADLSSRAGLLNDDHVGFNPALIPREMDMPLFIQPLSPHESNENRAMGAISRTFGAVKGDQSLLETAERKYDREQDGNVWSLHQPEIESRRDHHSLKDYRENPWWNLQEKVVKRSDASSLSRNRRNRQRASERRTPEMRIAGLRVSNFRRKSSEYCPKLAIAKRTVVRCTKGRKLGSKCSLTCTGGFVLAGKRKIRRCKRPRRQRRKHQQSDIPYWTGKQDDFQCVPVCRHLDLPEHGERSCEMASLPKGKALRCTTECDSGYKIVGSAQTICQENGSWSGQPAVCKAASTRQTVKTRFKFGRHQTLPCGEVHGLASFRQDGLLFLVAGDKVGGVVNVFRWADGKFDENPYQTFAYPSPEVVQVLSAPDGMLWLIVSGGGPVTMYRMHENGRFQLSHTTKMDMFGQKHAIGDTIGFAELRGEFYRCYGRNRRETPVIVVHKLQGKRTSGGDVFHRIMRKKLPGERVHQCSMYTEADSLYTIATLNKPDGRGRIIIGHLTKSRMKVVDVVSGKRLRSVTDSFGFSADGGRYIVVSQAVKNGKCLVYKRRWRTKPPAETG